MYHGETSFCENADGLPSIRSPSGIPVFCALKVNEPGADVPAERLNWVWMWLSPNPSWCLPFTQLRSSANWYIVEFVTVGVAGAATVENAPWTVISVIFGHPAG